MKNKPNTQNDPDMLDEYDFSQGIRGKYAERYKEGTNIIILEPDVMAYFPTSEAVNQALRVLIKAAKHLEKISENHTTISVP